jgi:hypothetical protein
LTDPPAGATLLFVPREKEPGMDIQEAKSRLRIEEVDAEAATCPACVEARRPHENGPGDPTAYCQAHLARIYGAR